MLFCVNYVNDEAVIVTFSLPNSFSYRLSILLTYMHVTKLQ